MNKSIILVLLLGLCVTIKAASQKWEDDPVLKAWLEEIRNEGSEAEPAAETFAPLVNTVNGTIRGETTYAIGGQTIYRYLGIPYAQPPVGELRFQAPQPYQGWGDAIYNATSHPNACLQYLTNLTKADEDCLYLSVYSRRQGGGVGNGPLLPVVFFIHGGGYAFGQNSVYGGYKLLAAEVVLVTLNYRLGPMGFFHVPGDNSTSANNAMKDMVQAMRWVQENIQAFGGDPRNVTVMGESAGSVSALYMMISPLAQGLFHRVIAMSGSPLQEWAIDRDPGKSARRLGALLNCTTDDTTELVRCLKSFDWFTLCQAHLGVIIEDYQDFKILLPGATPVIEGNVPNAFLTDDPLKLFLEGPLPQVPVMLGTVQHEGILPLAGSHYLILNPNGLLNNTEYMRDFFLGDLLKTWGVNERINGGSISQTLAVGYLKPGASRTNFTEMQYELLDMMSVAFMKSSVLRTADILSRRVPAVYLYNFEYYSPYGNSLYNLAFNLVEQIIGGKKPPIKPGICHADDLIYMFRLPFLLAPADITFQRKYCSLFTNFVIHGNPTPEESEDYPIWPKYEIDTQHYMKMDRVFEIKSDYTGSWRLGMRGETEEEEGEEQRRR